jgi:hypothetical protein
LTREWGDQGKGGGQFNALVMSLALDESGNLYAGDHGWVYYTDIVMRFQKFDPEGNFVAAWGSKGSAPGQFEGVWDLTADRRPARPGMGFRHLHSQTGRHRSSGIDHGFQLPICVQRHADVVAGWYHDRLLAV